MSDLPLHSATEATGYPARESVCNRASVQLIGTGIKPCSSARFPGEFNAENPGNGCKIRIDDSLASGCRLGITLAARGRDEGRERDSEGQSDGITSPQCLRILRSLIGPFSIFSPQPRPVPTRRVWGFLLRGWMRFEGGFAHELTAKLASTVHGPQALFC